MPPGRRPRVRTGTHWRDYISHLTWERLRIPQEELERGAGERDGWVSLLGRLVLRPDLRQGLFSRIICQTAKAIHEVFEEPKNELASKFSRSHTQYLWDVLRPKT